MKSNTWPHWWAWTWWHVNSTGDGDHWDDGVGGRLCVVVVVGGWWLVGEQQNRHR